MAAVTSRISHTSFDARDAYAQAQFWAAVLGFGPDPDEPDAPGDEECLIRSPDGATQLLFIEVPEAKSVKNRVHLDLRPVGTSRAAEVERVTALGARVLADHTRPDGNGWIAMADPEGNEFCVLRGEGN